MSAVVESKKMDTVEALKILATCRKASQPGKHDGTRLHFVYKAFGEPSDQAIEEAKRGEDLGIPSGHYTGRLDNIKTAADGSTIVVMFVELERDHKFRSFNLDKGEMQKIVVLGD